MTPPASSRPARPTAFVVATVADQLTVQYPEHIRVLLELGVELHVFASAHPDYLRSDRRVQCHVIPITRLLDLGGALRSVRLLVRQARQRRPAFVLYGSPSAALVGSVATRWLVPNRVLVVHGLREETLTGLRRRAAVTAGRLSARLSTLVVFVSPSVQRRAGYAPSRRGGTRATVAPGGFVGARLGPAGPERRAPRHRDDRPATVGFIGRLARDKGVEHLLASVATLRREDPELRLLLVGSQDATDPVPESVRRAIDDDPRTTWTGQVDDATARLDEMDVLCLPSYREGLPTVVLEAMAHGVPVVGTNATGVCDVVTPATGWPCETGSDTSLTAALRGALTQPEERRRRANAAQDMVRDQYRTEVVMRWWREQYEALLAGSVTPSAGPAAAATRGGPRAVGVPTG